MKSGVTPSREEESPGKQGSCAHLAQPSSFCAFSAPFCTPGSTCLIGLCCFSTPLHTWLNLPHSVLFQHPSAHLTQPSSFCAVSGPLCPPGSAFLFLCCFRTPLPTSLNLRLSVLFQDPSAHLTQPSSFCAVSGPLWLMQNAAHIAPCPDSAQGRL